MGFSRKFKDGDKVRVIKPNDSRYKQIGKIFAYYSDYFGKGVYSVKFKGNEFVRYKSNELELVEANISCNISPKKLSISDLKPGMKVRIRPDLKEGQSTIIYVYKDMENFAGTIVTIKGMLNNISDKYNCIYLENVPYAWDIDCFSEIIEEPKEEVKTSEKIEFPLKEGQVVTLLDGKKYQVIKNNTKEYSCNLCSLYIKNCGEYRCNITNINGKPSCPLVIPAGHYFKLYEDQKTEDNSSKSLTISDFKVENGNADESNNSSNSVENSLAKEVGIITKVNFTLTDFKSEELKHFKSTVL